MEKLKEIIKSVPDLTFLKGKLKYLFKFIWLYLSIQIQTYLFSLHNEDQIMNFYNEHFSLDVIGIAP